MNKALLTLFILCSGYLLAFSQITGKTRNTESKAAASATQQKDSLVKAEKVNAVQRPYTAKLQISPNPVTDICTITSHAPIQHLTLSDIIGNRVAHESGKEHYDFSFLPSGIYLIEARLSDGSTALSKMYKR